MADPTVRNAVSFSSVRTTTRVLKACHLAVFSGTLPSMEAEIDCKLQSNCLAGFVSRRKVTSTSSSEGEHMTLGKHLIASLFSALVVIPCSTLVFAQTSSEVAKGGPPTASVDHNGQHDFDSFAGTWKCHTKYRAHPFSLSDTTWIEFDGTETFQKLWDGAMLELSKVASANGPAGLMLYTYNPQSHQWWVYFANSQDGKVGPPNVGEFKNGRGEFFAQDTVNGKLLLNRYVWSQMCAPDWEVNWSAYQTWVNEDESGEGCFTLAESHSGDG